MDLKRWFPGLCLVLILVSEILLFRANHDRTFLKAQLAASRAALAEVQSELDDLQASNHGSQSMEVSRLRRLNEILYSKNNELTGKNAGLQATVNRLQQEGEQTAQHLTTARTAIELQQQHLQQMQDERAQNDLQACLDNLRLIDAAKQQWALDKNADANATPTSQDLAPYFKESQFPVCPSGGTYTIGSMTQAPVCSYPGHVTPPPAAAQPPQ
jgi:hypothetical protein